MNAQILANDGESVVLVFTITCDIPPVETSNIRWYYTTSAPSGIPNFNSADFQEITNLTGRTSRSTLTFSSDRLSLTISNVVQSIGGVIETDQGRYFIRASNPAGDVNSFIDVVVRGRCLLVSSVLKCSVLYRTSTDCGWTSRQGCTGSS